MNTDNSALRRQDPCEPHSPAKESVPEASLLGEIFKRPAYTRRKKPKSLGELQALVMADPNVLVVISDYLKDFWTHLPYGDHDPLMRGSFIRSLIPPEKWEMPHGLHGYSDLEGRHSSKSFLRQTPEEFYSAVDKAVECLGVDLARLRALTSKHRDEMPREDAIELHMMLLPVYLHLRQLGYNRFDLT
jgi:hypothetical protein